jgi:hypothetical protein
MQASSSGHPAQEDLMAISDGQAPEHVVAHIKTCSTCADRVEGYGRIQSDLRRSLFRFDCPDAHTLGEYELNLLDSEMRIVVAAHATECAECASELQSLRSYLGMSVEVPDSILTQARRLIASLFPASPGFAYAGLRGAETSSARVYRVEDVSVTVGPGQGRGTLVGLVVVAGTSAEELEGLGARLIPVEGDSLATRLDDLGNFEFANVSPGSYALEIDVLGNVVVIEELHVD